MTKWYERTFDTPVTTIVVICGVPFLKTFFGRYRYWCDDYTARWGV